MEKFLKSFWKSVTEFFDRLADNADVILLTVLKIILLIIAAKLIIWITGLAIKKLIKRKKKKIRIPCFPKNPKPSAW